MAEDAQQFTAKTILLVEDDEDTREFLTLAITTETTYHILSMGSGLETLQSLDEVLARRPVLLMLDYRLPAMTALDLYYRLRTTKELENVPAIIITADPLDMETRRTLKELNIAVLEKPFDLNELIYFIEQAVRLEALAVIDSHDATQE
jgi:DNA-binding response OmpR family regulator